jgi:hypothetical protein
MKSPYSSLLESLLDRARSFYGESLVTVAVFGSVGRGAATSGSDIDLVIVAGDLPRGRTKRIDAFLKLEKLLQPEMAALKKLGFTPELSPVIKTPEEVRAGSLLFLDMIDDAKIFFDKDDFFKNFLAGFRVRLERLGAKKIIQGDHWYWDLKPDYKYGDVFEI